MDEPEGSETGVRQFRKQRPEDRGQDSDRTETRGQDTDSTKTREQRPEDRDQSPGNKDKIT